MIVKLLCQRVGVSRFGGYINQMRGTVVVVDDAEGRRMIAAGQAVEVDTETRVETQMLDTRGRGNATAKRATATRPK